MRKERAMITPERYGPWALVAGGSEGLGACFAHRLARAGLDLVLLARRADPLAATAQAVREATGRDVRTLALDLAGDNMLERIRAVTDGLDVGLLVYNAGGAGGPCALAEQKLDEALANLKLNAVGQTKLAHHFGAPMRARGRGGLIFIGSMGCIAGSKNLAVYSAAKAYTQTFAEALWAEMSPHGVDVLAAIIGRTLTPALLRAGLTDTEEAPAADPDAMAALALGNLQNGPVVVAPEHIEAFEAMRAMPRRKAVEIMARSMEAQTRR
jgi:short-subunit dehydrogenase